MNPVPPTAMHSRQHLEPYDRHEERSDEEQPPKRGRLVEDKDAHKYGAHSSYARPNGIGCAKRKRLRGLCQ